MEVKRRVIAADVRIMRLEELLSKWVSYCDQAGVRPVSGDVRDNPVLQLIKDSRAALGKLCEDEGCPHYGKPHEHPERRASQVEREP